MVTVDYLQTSKTAQTDCNHKWTCRILDRGGQTGRLPLARLKVGQLNMDCTKLNTDGLQIVMEIPDYFLVKGLHRYCDEGK